MTTAEPINSIPLRILNKGPEYFRSTSSSSQNSDSRRKTAAERLEADKFKYVKSAKARQRRATIELQSSPSQNNDSTGTQSMGTASTGSPITVDDDDITEYTANEAGNDASIEGRLSGGQQYKPQVYQSSHRKLNRSNTDVDTTSRIRFNAANRLRNKSLTDQSANVSLPNTPVTKLKDLNCGPPERRNNRSQSPKEGRPGKSITSYLNNAKEKIKAVTSTIASGSSENADAGKGRQSRSAVAKPNKYRSASVGASVHRNRDVNGVQKQSNQTKNTSNSVVMSPRSQLKHVRENLKKVNPSKNDENRNFSPIRRRGTTFTVTPKNKLIESASSPEMVTENNVARRQNTSISDKPNRLKGRPLSVIENKVTPNQVPPSINDKVKVNKTEVSTKQNVRRRSSSSGKEDDQASSQGNDVDISSFTNSSGANIRRLSSQRFKRRSWDLAHTMDNSLQLSLPKPTIQPTSFTPDPDSTPTSPLNNLPRQRKSWSRPPPATSTEYKKGGNRISFHEDTYQNRPGTRKSITEALEEIFNPLECDDDMDTAYNSMSPDASMDCKTLVGPNQNYGEKSSNSIAENINSILRGIRTSDDSVLRSKTPESSRSKTPTGDDGISFAANEIDVTVKTSVEQKFLPGETKTSPQSSPGSLSRHKHGYRSDIPANVEPEQRQWLTSNDWQPGVCQPLNRIDLAPTSTAQINGGIPNSPMLAPRARREVVPEYTSRSNTASLSRNGYSKEEHLNTMKSQNTSSSASGDVNKPLTALTASDLKPRRGKRSIMPQTVPIKPTCPYAVNGYRGTPKRHNNTPLSPTLSPNKQPARMTPPHGSRSPSSTPYSSLKRTPTSSRSSSLKRNRQRSKSDVSVFQNELDRFFSTMGMEEHIISPLPASQDTLFTTAHVSSESDFSFAGASAYVRDSPDETMEVDPVTASLANVPSVSIIEKNARVMRWLMSCKKSMVANNPSPQSPRHAPPVPMRPTQSYNPQIPSRFTSYPPPIPPRISSYQKIPAGVPKESDV